MSVIAANFSKSSASEPSLVLGEAMLNVRQDYPREIETIVS